MPDYRQKAAQANAWRRASSLSIYNPRAGQKGIVFEEEDVVVLDGATFSQPAPPGQVRGVFDPEAEFPLLNPETGEPVGVNVTQMQLYVMLHSLYLHLATRRDVAQAAAQQG